MARERQIQVMSTTSDVFYEQLPGNNRSHDCPRHSPCRRCRAREEEASHCTFPGYGGAFAFEELDDKVYRVRESAPNRRPTALVLLPKIRTPFHFNRVVRLRSRDSIDTHFAPLLQSLDHHRRGFNLLVHNYSVGDVPPKQLAGDLRAQIHDADWVFCIVCQPPMLEDQGNLYLDAVPVVWRDIITRQLRVAHEVENVCLERRLPGGEQRRPTKKLVTFGVGDQIHRDVWPKRRMLERSHGWMVTFSPFTAETFRRIGKFFWEDERRGRLIRNAMRSREEYHRF